MNITLKEKAYIQLRDLILNGELQPGQFLTERELVNRLGMSRTPIRSALERLEVEGYIINSPNKGPVVAEISAKKAADIYDIRIALESHVSKKLSLNHLDEKQLEWFKQNLKEQKKYIVLKDYVAFSLKDAEFHKKLILIYNNTEIIRIFEQIQNKLQLLALKVFRTDIADLQVYYDDHQKIIDFIQLGESEKAQEKMIMHLEFGKNIHMT